MIVDEEDATLGLQVMTVFLISPWRTLRCTDQLPDWKNLQVYVVIKFLKSIKHQYQQ